MTERDQPEAIAPRQWTPEAFDRFLEATGLTREQAQAATEREADAIDAQWQAYRARHRGATVQDFVAWYVQEQMTEMGVEAGLPPDVARRTAARTWAKTEAQLRKDSSR